MIQVGKRNTRCALFAVAALGVSASAFAQTPPPPPDPAAPGQAPASPVPPDPGAPALTSQQPPPAPPPPVAPEPPKPTFPSMGGPFIRLNEIFSFRPGLLLQFWSTATQDALPKANGDDGGLAYNLYMRRARLFLTGTAGPRLTWLILMESVNMGLSTNDAGNAGTGGVNKGFSTPSTGAGVTFGLDDAFFDFKASSNISIQAGLMIIPFTRNILQSTTTYWTNDIAAVSATYLGATQTNVLRDTGIQLKINALDNHLEARAMVSQGVKRPDPDGMGRSPGKNDPRFTGYLQYNFFDPDTGYVFNGQYFGKKKIAGLAVGGDFQKIDDDSQSNPYFATSATLFAAIPLKGADPKGGDEIGGQIEYLHFHGGGGPAVGTPSGLGKRDGFLGELGYYNKAGHFSIFGKFEGTFIDGAGETANTRLIGGGAKYFFAEQIANLTLQGQVTQFPKAVEGTRNDAKALQLQLQLAY